MAKVKRPLIWIAGNYYESRRYWKEVCGKLQDPNVDSLDCMDGSILAADIILKLKNKDIFDSRPRIIRLDGLPYDYTVISDYLHLVNNSNVLVVMGPLAARPKPPATKMLTVKNSNFYKTFKSEGTILESVTDFKTDLEATKWIKQVASDLQRNIDQEAVQLLVSMEGRNCDKLYSAFLKLCDYSTAKKIVTDDVTACCLPSFYDEVWSLLSHLDNRDLDRAMKHIQKFHTNAGTEVGRSYYGDVQMMLGALLQHFLFVMSLKDTCQDQISYRGAEQAIRGLKKRVSKNGRYEWQDLFSIGYMKSSFSRAGVKSVFSWPKKQVYNAVREILRCQKLCRTSGGRDSKIRLYVDTMILAICGQVNSENLR